MRQAVLDLSLLLDKGYARDSSLKLVGDRYELNKRQRVAVARSACSDKDRDQRIARLTGTPSDSGLFIDGYNVLTTLESVLGGGVVLYCRDTSFRDMAALHGTWRKVQETIPALRLIAAHAKEAGFSSCTFFLDKPVSNSARLKKIILDIALEYSQNWQVELHSSPDLALIQADSIVASSDSYILDNCKAWYNLAGQILTKSPQPYWEIDLS
jgi:hypothetical protein